MKLKWEYDNFTIFLIQTFLKTLNGQFQIAGL